MTKRKDAREKMVERLVNMNERQRWDFRELVLEWFESVEESPDHRLSSRIAALLLPPTPKKWGVREKGLK